MKRALVVLLALVMGAGLLFAADQAPPKWGYYMEGWANLYDQDGNAFLGPNWTTDAATGQYNNLSFSYAEPTMGLSFLVEFDSNAAWSNNIRNLSGWMQVLPILKVTAGRVRDGSYRPTSYVEGTSVVTRILNAEWGLLLQLMPVKGLSVGAAVKFPEVATPQDYVDNIGLGVSYDVANIGMFYLNWRSMDSGVSPALKENEFGAAAKISAIKALPLYLSFAMSLYDVNDPMIAVLFSTKYVMGDLSVLLDAKFQYQSGAATEFQYGNELSVQYAMKPYTLGLNVGYGNMAFATGANLGGLFVYPWASMAVGSASSLKLGFILDTDGDDAGADVLKWSIPLRYIFSF
jgi:hypothetical protein